MPAEWGLIALVERKMRHTLGGGQCSERVYVTKYHHSTSRTGLISDSYRKGLADPESGMDENSKERLVPEREGAKHPRYPALLFVRKWFRACHGARWCGQDEGSSVPHCPTRTLKAAIRPAPGRRRSGPIRAFLGIFPPLPLYVWREVAA
jgi:hypothetical protein